MYKCKICGNLADKQDKCCGEIMAEAIMEFNIEIIKITRIEEKKNEI